MAAITEANLGLTRLIPLTRVCRKSWEHYSRTRRNGITEEIRQELNAMKNVISRVVPEKLANDFRELAQQWERERPRGVDVLDMVMHPAYQRIIGMGPDVVPFLLEELERKPGHWFLALQAITGANPVVPDSEGNLKEMAEAWIDWGKKQGYKL